MIFPVKRLAVTALIALYTLMLMWSTVDRTYSWAAKQSEAMSRPGSDDEISIGRVHPVSTVHQAHRRIIQNPFVVEPPMLASWFVLSPQILHLSTDLLPTSQDARRLSGRAPPRSL